MNHRSDGALLRAGMAKVWLAASLLAVVFFPALASANDGHVVKVEEDWELVLLEPEAAVTAPQLTCTISPLGQSDSVRAAFDLNHASAPAFSAGGMQLQVWQGDQCVSSRRKYEGAAMNKTGETVKWTTRMSINDNVLSFSVVNGVSETWGNFSVGRYNPLAVSTNLSHLDAYSSNTTVEQSGVGFAGNRVSSLVLKKVRRYWSNGQVTEDNEPKSVYPE